MARKLDAASIAALDGIIPHEVAPPFEGEARTFIGNGTGRLDVDPIVYDERNGGAQIYGFVIEGVAQPIEFSEEVLVDPGAGKVITMTYAFASYGLSPAPHLQRCVKSNDGIWQKGRAFIVYADWAPVKR